MHAQIKQTALSLIMPNKGILASDESIESANKSLHKANVTPTEENRRKYRELFISCPDVEKYISGIILYEETLNQEDSGGTPFYKILQDKEILIGLKLDEGLYDIPNFEDEKATKGLDRLEERIELYKSKGIAFAKWRAVYKIDQTKGLPTEQAIRLNSYILAQYSSICIKNGILPIVEPEVLMDGSHTINECYSTTEKVLTDLFATLKEFRVSPEDIVLKMNMVVAGKLAQATAPKTVAEHTMKVIEACVPKDIAGVVFLSGGQSATQATENLNEIAKLNTSYRLSFSFLRAVEGPALALWAGEEANFTKARAEFISRLKTNILAQKGEYS